METRELDQAKHDTAFFKNEVDEDAQYAFERITEHQTDPMLKKDIPRQTKLIQDSTTNKIKGISQWPILKL